MAKQKFLVTGDQHVSIDKKMLDIKRQLYLKNGSPLNPDLVIKALQAINEGTFGPKLPATPRQLIPATSCLYIIDEASNLRLGRSDGELFLDGRLKFTDNFSDVEKNLNVRGQKHSAIRASAYELTEKEIAVRIFNSFSAEPGILEKVWLTQKQIMDICSFHFKHLNPGGYGNLFLTRKDECSNMCVDNLFVLRVMVKGPGKFDFSLQDLSYANNAHPGNRKVRVFVPQQFKLL